MSIAYGNAPTVIGEFDLDFTEYMHFMYLPISIPEVVSYQYKIPPALEFAREMIIAASRNEIGKTLWTHVYVTARRGYATPGNPLNRPGWHSDGFGTDDVNYVWTDRFPTLFAEQEFTGISHDHIVSAHQFSEQIKPEHIRTYPDKVLLRLDPSVIHAAPEIPAPGGERSFFKISFSNNRYNLRGNAHNHLLSYDWPMYDRASVRNDPSHAGQDGGERG